MRCLTCPWVAGASATDTRPSAYRQVPEGRWYVTASTTPLDETATGASHSISTGPGPGPLFAIPTNVNLVTATNMQNDVGSTWSCTNCRV
ncbi:hypothetical protein ACI65C_011925, partial [Semiaphis heraclei]